MIFIRPLVVRDASVEGDLAAYRRYVPDNEFFRDTRPIAPQVEDALQRMERGELPKSESVPVDPDPMAPGARS